ncbi:Glycosyltransferase involved in cell wall bisynthesis [Sporobacter termitidis DSM 10068]|uniref:Glycosyltransferase involved in cell wall bisynthesis n=1 Tax=Sporobacter termitidis DSM 10068 TaxID=1123282 RepID=A0A1M5Z7V0_9FIRM|nr:glycosyltransferase family 1 protein [Sporobacter termitidis]SHI20168.1 Glycosyltransferase involved in cell wall bisynthesis [Sporobacter termitidis DSM 10068]
MKIAYFTDTFSPQINGVTNTLNQLSRYLSQRDIDHIFFAPDYDAADEPQDTAVLRFKGIRPVIYPECRLVFPPYGKILEALHDFRPDLIHVVTELGIGYSGLKAARELGIPLVMSYHTNYDKYLDFYNLGYLSRPIWAYVRWFHNFAALNLCPSVSTAAELDRRGFKNLDIWTRGIDMQRFSPEHRSPAVRHEIGGAGKTVFLYVGRIAREKGLDVLAESIGIVNASHRDDGIFVFTGDGPYLDALKAMEIPNAVFTGPQTGRKLAQIYASGDVFVFPSGSETFGNVLLEAMASGLPGICVDAGGVTDFTEHGKNAYVCKYNDPGALAEAMTAMLDQNLRNKIRAGALETARARDWDTIFDRLVAGYENALGKNHPARRLAV